MVLCQWETERKSVVGVGLLDIMYYCWRVDALVAGKIWNQCGLKFDQIAFSLSKSL